MLKQSIVLVLTKSSTMAFGFFNSLFILHFVDENIRGYFFTFSSVAAFAIIFELGIGTVVGQFLAHESAHFEIKKTIIIGDERRTDRFFDILRTTLIWYSKVLSVGFLVIFCVGFGIFSSKNPNFMFWIIPWAAFLIFTLFNILLELVFNAVYVTISVNRAQINKTIVLVVTFLICWSLIVLDAKNSLQYLTLIPVLTFTFNLLAGIVAFPQIFLSVLRKVSSDFSWKNEVLNLQKRTAISYASGALIFNLFTPTMFYFHGSEAAARIGISLQFASAIPSIVNYLISVQSLKLGIFFSKGMTLEAIETFKNIFKIVLSIFLLGGFSILAIYIFPLSQKLVSPLELILLYLSYSINSIIYLMAIFIRSQKKEHFGIFSVVFALVTALVIPISTYYFSSLGQTISFFLINIVISLPWSFLIFYTDFNNSRKKIYA